MVAEVVRIFEDEEIHHVSGAVDPMSDIETINLELILADAETVSKRLQSVERDAKRGDKDAITEKTLLERMLQHLQSGQLANTLALSDEERELLHSLHLLTMKAFLYVCNKKSGAFNLDEQNDERWQELVDFFGTTGSEYVVVDAGVEHELKDLDEAERTEFRREYGTQDSGVDDLIRASYHRLGLMSYYTTGEKETRAWTIKQGSTAPEAGAAIHSDFQAKFIRAHVVSLQHLIDAGSKAAAKEAGKVRTEGKEYVVQDGDVIEFLHS
jgi:GTP-binding protein YchF